MRATMLALLFTLMGSLGMSTTNGEEPKKVSDPRELEPLNGLPKFPDDVLKKELPDKIIVSVWDAKQNTFRRRIETAGAIREVKGEIHIRVHSGIPNGAPPKGSEIEHNGTIYIVKKSVSGNPHYYHSCPCEKKAEAKKP